MPTYRGLTVNVVVDSYGQPDKSLEEWGTVKTSQWAGNRATCYVESIKNLRFGIKVVPQLPFYFPIDQPPTANDDEDQGSEAMDETDDQDEFLEYLQDKELKENDSVPSLSGGSSAPSVQSAGSASVPALQDPSSAPVTVPYHLLVRVCLNGKQTPETSRFVFLDQNHADRPSQMDGVWINSGYYKDKAGRVFNCKWKFQDAVGIETLLGGLSLDENEPQPASSDPASQGQQPGKIGQITVTFDRVVLGNYCEGEARAPDDIEEKEEEDEEQQQQPVGEGASAGVGTVAAATHSIGYEQAQELGTAKVRCLGWTPYRPGEAPFATVVFLYRSRAVLRKFNFPGFPAAAPSSALVRRSARLLGLHARLPAETGGGGGKKKRKEREEDEDGDVEMGEAEEGDGGERAAEAGGAPKRRRRVSAAEV